MTVPLQPGPLRRPGHGSPSAVPSAPPGLPLGLLAPPSTPVFPPGYQPVPADLTAWIQRTLGFCCQWVVFRAHQSVSQGPGSGTSTLTLDMVDEDPYGGWDATHNRWLAPWTGWYEVTVTAASQAQALWLTAAMSVSGGTSYQEDAVLCSGGNSGGSTASQYVPMIGGQDYVTPQVNASAGFSTEVVYPGRCSGMEISFLSE